jgi:hypothetical protein
MDLPTWEICAITAGTVVIGSVVVFLLCLALALLLQSLTGVREPPAMVIFAAREIVGYIRRRLAWGAPCSEGLHSEPAVVASSGRNRILPRCPAEIPSSTRSEGPDRRRLAVHCACNHWHSPQIHLKPRSKDLH